MLKSPLVAAAHKAKTMTKARVKVPETATAGEVVTIKALASHIMESGHRLNLDGGTFPRKIINTFECRFNDAVVFGCDMGTGVAANPFFEFRVKVRESGTFKFQWIDDDGSVIEAEQSIEVS